MCIVAEVKCYIVEITDYQIGLIVGDHDRPETCNSTTWPKDFPTNFYKKNCPDAYSYTFDPNKESYTCISSHYRIHFGASY